MKLGFCKRCYLIASEPALYVLGELLTRLGCSPDQTPSNRLLKSRSEIQYEMLVLPIRTEIIAARITFPFQEVYKTKVQ
jgi:hypothetical protein